MALSPKSVGILCLVTGIAVFSVQDVILKRLSGEYPLYQAMIIRSLTALPLHALIVLWMDGRLSTIASPRWPWMFARGFLNFVAYTAYYLGLAAMPMADTVALFFTAPLFITTAAVLFLGERMTTTTLFAVAMAFGGVLLIVRPGAGLFDPAALLPILGALGYAMSMLAARVLGRTETAMAMAFWGNLTSLAAALALAALFGAGGHDGAAHPSLAFLTRGWQPMPAQDLALFMSCGLIASIGLSLLTQAYRIAPSTTVAPFEYTFIIWGLLWGWTFWGQLPTSLGVLGIGFLIIAGIIVVRDDEAKKKAAP
jgi:drug/metabolite transporter (DMT)-like permease